MKEKFIKINNLSVDKILADFIDNELLPDTNISPKKFWDGFDKVVHELAPKNRQLLEIRETIQKEIDLWHKKNKFEEFNLEDYKNFLKDIGYLKEEGPEFKIETKNLDTEISSIAGPQLVVPIMNARYSLNAANARWMSLYDSLYGTDLIESEESGSEKYDPLRGEQVINYARDFLNKHFPINGIELGDEILKEEKVIIQDLITAAHNNAKSQLKSRTSEEISKATGGFGVPGFKWPL